MNEWQILEAINEILAELKRIRTLLEKPIVVVQPAAPTFEPTK